MLIKRIALQGTLKATSLRFLVATAALQGLHMSRFDFVSAFLQGDLEPGEQIAHVAHHTRL